MLEGRNHRLVMDLESLNSRSRSSRELLTFER
jgi:hypothetical protein